MKIALAILGLIAVRLISRRRKRSAEEEKRFRGAYPYHNGPFS